MELDPNYNLLKPSKGENTAGGVPWSKQSDLKERITERRNDVIREFQDGQPGQVLDLDLPLPINWNSKQNGKFSQLNVDEKRRGASEILKEFGDEDEELELRPIDINKDNKNIHAKWKKESDIRGASQERKLIDADLSDEELILSPHSPKTKQNSITQWNKQSSKIDSALLSPDDELILSPKVPTNMKSGPSWNKQDTNRFNSDKFNQSEEELILSPKKIQKSGSQGKFRSANSLSEVKIPDVDEEELILAPQDPSVNRIKTGPSWKSQDQNLQGVSEVIKSSEELILTPTRPTKIKSLGGKWEKQNDVVEDLEKKSEELIISPKVPTKSTQTAAWSKQSESIANIDQKSLQNEEVILFPSKPSKKSTVPKNSQQKQKNIETKPKDSKQMTPKRVSFESNSKIESTEKRRNNESKSSTGSNRTQSNLQNTLPVTPPKLQTLTPSETAVPYSFNKDSDKEIQLLDTKLRELGI